MRFGYLSRSDRHLYFYTSAPFGSIDIIAYTDRCTIPIQHNFIKHCSSRNLLELRVPRRGGKANDAAMVRPNRASESSNAAWDNPYPQLPRVNLLGDIPIQPTRDSARPARGVILDREIPSPRAPPPPPVISRLK